MTDFRQIFTGPGSVTLVVPEGVEVLVRAERVAQEDEHHEPPPPPPPSDNSPGQFFPHFYRGTAPTLAALAGPPHNYPKGATVGKKGPRGGDAWGVVNPASSTADMPMGFEPLSGKVGE